MKIFRFIFSFLCCAVGDRYILPYRTFLGIYSEFTVGIDLQRSVSASVTGHEKQVMRNGLETKTNPQQIILDVQVHTQKPVSLSPFHFSIFFCFALSPSPNFSLNLSSSFSTSFFFLALSSLQFSK